MSDSYERIQDQAALEQQRLRAGLLLELEIDMIEEDKKDNAKFPSHLHVLIPKDHDETKFDGGNQWLGVLGAIKGEISEQGEKSNKRMDAKFYAVETKISAVETKISVVETKMDESNKKMDEILSILKSSPKT